MGRTLSNTMLNLTLQSAVDEALYQASLLNFNVLPVFLQSGFSGLISVHAYSRSIFHE